MGLFGNIMGSTVTKLSPQEAFVGILICVIGGDGHMSEQEIDDFNSAVRKAKILRGLSNNQFSNAVDKTFALIKKQGIQAFLDIAVPALPEESRKGTFTIACDLAFSDGSIEQEEEDIIEDLKSRLEIDDELAQLTIYVINNKNNV